MRLPEAKIKEALVHPEKLVRQEVSFLALAYISANRLRAIQAVV